MVRFVCLNTGVLSFRLIMVTIISKMSFCRNGKMRESNTKIRLLGVDPSLQSDGEEGLRSTAGGCWTGLGFADSPQGVGFVVCSHISLFTESWVLFLWLLEDCVCLEGTGWLLTLVCGLGRDKETASLQYLVRKLSVWKSTHLPRSVLASHIHYQHGIILYGKTKPEPF